MAPLILGLLAGCTVLLLLAPGPPPGRPGPLARFYARLGAPPLETERRGCSAPPPLVRRLPLAPAVTLLRRLLPPRYHQATQRLLRIARLDDRYTSDDILAMKAAAVLVPAFYGLMLFLKHPNPTTALIMAGACLLSFAYPDSWLAARVRHRQEQIWRELPATLSALAVALEAGLNLMAAVAEVARDRPGVLAEELQGAVQLYERGLPQAAALETVASRVEVPELTVILTGLVQAVGRGSDHVVTAVREQAADAWGERRRRAEAMAQTASLKLFLPIALLALPAFLIFLLGPAALEIMEYFRE